MFQRQCTCLLKYYFTSARAVGVVATESAERAHP